jgi:HEAT repeats
MTRILWNIVAVVALALGVRANDAEPNDQDVPPLLAQLKSDDWRSRQEAVDKLVAMGDAAIPHLQRLLAGATDNEVRSRAASAIARIEDQRRVGASMVTLKLAGAPASRAFEELFRQAQATVQTEPADLLSGKNAAPVSLDVERRPFWDVMRSLCAQTGLEPTTLNRHGRDVGLALVAPGSTLGSKKGAAGERRAWDDRPTVLAGPLLIRADRLMLVSNVHLKAPQAVVREFHIVLTAFAEPKLKVLDYSGVLRLDEAVDDRGNSLVPLDDQGQGVNAEVFGNARGGYTSHWELGTTLRYPLENRGERIVRFKARASMEVMTQSATLDLPLREARNASKTVGGVRMFVKGFDSPGNRCDIVVNRDGRTDPEWYRLRGLFNVGEARLLDSQGRTIARTAPGIDAEENGESDQLDVHLRFERGGGEKASSEAVRLVWEFPVETRQVVVPFEFRDLPMP